jgi:hypothetical protein
MKTIFKLSVLTLATLGLLAPATFAQDPTPAVAPSAPATGAESLMVAPTKVGEALSAANASEGRANQMRRVAEALDTQLRAALGSTRKFSVHVGTNYNDVIEEIARQNSGAFKSDDSNKATVGEMLAPKYKVIPQIDDFQDVAEQLVAEGAAPVASARRVRLSLVLSIVDAKTGVEKETTNVQVADRKVLQINPNIRQTGDQNDAILLALTRQAAQVSAQRILDVFFPAKVIGKVDKTITINRGDGTFIAVGQVWDAFALGEELKDPDTGAVLGHDEVPSGKVKITSVTAKFSKATIIEDIGIDKGHVVRLQEPKPQEEQMPQEAQ